MMHMCISSVFFGSKQEDEIKYLNIFIFWKQNVIEIKVLKPVSQQRRKLLCLRIVNISSYLGGTD